jgi:hypothetical protein
MNAAIMAGGTFAFIGMSLFELHFLGLTIIFFRIIFSIFSDYVFTNCGLYRTVSTHRGVNICYLIGISKLGS